jgi:hypothetical protein
MSDDVSGEDTVRAVDDAISTTIDEEEVILNLETSSYHGLNRVGSEIWTRIQEPRTVDELVAALDDEYDVATPKLEADVREFVADLDEAGLVDVQS